MNMSDVVVDYGNDINDADYDDNGDYDDRD